jgi:predicted alpha/beta hydrolase family esterase
VEGELSFLILHGYGYDRDPAHWHSRLARHLAAQGHRVSYPQLADPDEPSLDAWRETLRAELNSLPSAGSVVVCHSLACLLWIHHCSEIHRPVERLLLVSPPEDDEVPEPAAPFRLGDHLDIAALRASSDAAPRVVRGENDPYSPSGVPAWATRAHCEVDTIAGAEHLNPDDGYGPWPDLERWCLDPSVRLGA